MSDENAVSGIITIGDLESAAICGQPRPWGPAAVLCGFGPGHAGGHSWEIEAEPDEPEGEPAHLHHWVILGAQPHIPSVMFGKPVPHTIALVRCTECGMPDALLLAGEWTLDDLRSTGARS